MSGRIHIGVGMLGLLLHGCLLDQPETAAMRLTPQEQQRVLTLSPVPPPPPDPTNNWADADAAAAFGRTLFYDTRFSGTQSVSCASCHQPQRSWTDGLALSRGLGQTSRHAPSLWNIGNQRWFFWDGRADTLWSQALGPLEDPKEHGGSRLQYVHTIQEDPTLRLAYEGIFGPLPDVSDRDRYPGRGRPSLGPEEGENALTEAWDGMLPDDQRRITQVYVNMGKSLAAFQRTFRSTNAPFDTYVAGIREDDIAKRKAMSDAAVRGLQLFLGEARCHLCHDGPLFSDLEFHNTGLTSVPVDIGRAGGIEQLESSPFHGGGAWSDAAEGAARDKVASIRRSPDNLGRFKTPSLRNVGQTAPYMHDGRFASLAEVVAFYVSLEGAALDGVQEKLLRPLTLNDQQQRDLVSFLESLSDSEVPDHLLAEGEVAQPLSNETTIGEGRR